jgi:hypothetical protein
MAAPVDVLVVGADLTGLHRYLRRWLPGPA